MENRDLGEIPWDECLGGLNPLSIKTLTFGGFFVISVVNLSLKVDVRVCIAKYA